MAHKDVVDAHALIWYLEGNPRLGAAAKGRIDAPDSELVLPIIALAEAAWVVERRRSSIPSVGVLLERVQADPRIEVFDLTLELFRKSLTLQVIPELHDRLIVATALQLQSAGHGVTLLTTDAIITAANIVTCVW